MTDDNTLVCTNCDSIVEASVGYDGYYGQCECHSFHFKVGSGDSPHSWEKWEDAKSPIDFGVYNEGEFRGGTVVESDHVVCSRCKDRKNVEVSVETVNVGEVNIKATFRCTADHFHNDRVIESVGYYDSSSLYGQTVVGVAEGNDNDVVEGIKRGIKDIEEGRTMSEDDLDEVLKDDG